VLWQHAGGVRFVGEEGKEGVEGGMSCLWEEFYHFIGYTVWAGCLFGAEGVDYFI
jgi:hypothetical protein